MTKRFLERPSWLKRQYRRLRYGRFVSSLDLHRTGRRFAVPLRVPLVLISQVQRSGGTLLSQLFDGHPECHAHPYELYVGYPHKSIWPRLDMGAGPKAWFDVLFESPAAQALRNGYQKYDRGRDEHPDTFSFLFLPSLQREIFLECVESLGASKPRDVFDAFMTSYFGAWLNNRNAGSDKRVITAFVPRMAMDDTNVDAFFEVYPDGKLLSVIRDPGSWYHSARVHDESATSEYAEVGRAIALWESSARSMMSNADRYPGRVSIIRFEDLVGDTEGTMRRVAAFMGISFHETLTLPTFNGFPIKANSSYPVRQYGVIRDPIERHVDRLTDSEKETIARLSEPTYSEVLQRAIGLF